MTTSLAERELAGDNTVAAALEIFERAVALVEECAYPKGKKPSSETEEGCKACGIIYCGGCLSRKRCVEYWDEYVCEFINLGKESKTTGVSLGDIERKLNDFQKGKFRGRYNKELKVLLDS